MWKAIAYALHTHVYVLKLFLQQFMPTFYLKTTTKTKKQNKKKQKDSEDVCTRKSNFEQTRAQMLMLWHTDTHTYTHPRARK